MSGLPPKQTFKEYKENRIRIDGIYNALSDKLKPKNRKQRRSEAKKNKGKDHAV